MAWNTGESARAKVFYSTSVLDETEAQADFTEPYISGQVASDTGLHTNQVITLSNLSRNTTYYYRAMSIDQTGNVSVSASGTFVTSN